MLFTGGFSQVQQTLFLNGLVIFRLTIKTQVLRQIHLLQLSKDTVNITNLTGDVRQGTVNTEHLQFVGNQITIDTTYQVHDSDEIYVLNGTTVKNYGDSELYGKTDVFGEVVHYNKVRFSNNSSYFGGTGGGIDGDLVPTVEGNGALDTGYSLGALSWHGKIYISVAQLFILVVNQSVLKRKWRNYILVSPMKMETDTSIKSEKFEVATTNTRFDGDEVFFSSNRI